MKLFVTNVPAFYKINLYNKISEKINIKVVFTERPAKWRNSDFISGEMKFDYYYLNPNKYICCLQLFKILQTVSYDEIIISGWTSLPAWMTVMVSHKYKNSVVVESSIFESSITGWKAKIKRLFLTRTSKAYVSGTPHKRLVEALGFAGDVVITNGVGVFNYIPQPKFTPRKEVKNFIFVGRLVEVKNLKFLIERFNEHPDLNLHIVGFGILEEELKRIANSNITFYGAVENVKLNHYYQQADVFIMSSKSEPWGLVAEEALNNGLPLMLSDTIGCHEDLVNEKTGVVYSLNKISFDEKLELLLDVDRYNSMREYISHLNFEAIEQNQVNCYLG